MAELTPNTWDVLTDRFGGTFISLNLRFVPTGFHWVHCLISGLRRMADQANRHISRWYIEEWGSMTNIVAVDFIRGTNLMETALYWNGKKDILSPSR